MGLCYKLDQAMELVDPLNNATIAKILVFTSFVYFMLERNTIKEKNKSFEDQVKLVNPKHHK